MDLTSRAHISDASLIRLGLGLCMALLACCGVKETLRLARAEVLCRKDTIGALRDATHLTPEDAAIYARLATLDSSRTDDLRLALALNPRDPSLWIMQSVHLEEDGDEAGAEQSLVTANAVSRYHNPRWCLAAFYYRHRNTEAFIHWAKLALSTGNAQPDSLLLMAEKLGLPPDRILDDLLPQTPRQLEEYMYRLRGQSRIDDACDAAKRLIRCGARQNRESVLGLCEAAFQAGKVDQAIALWNAAIDARWIPLSRLAPADGKSLANESLWAERWEPGFDWKLHIQPGILVSRSEKDRSLCFEMSGGQPESGDLISQFVALLPNRHYMMKVRYRLESTNYAGGLQWSVVGVRSGEPWMQRSLDTSSKAFQEQSLPFTTPAHSQPAKVLLSVRRVPGTTRTEGRVWIQSVHLTLQP